MKDTAEITFPRSKIKPVFVKNETLQSLRMIVQFSEEGLEITLVGRHEKTRGEVLSPNQRVKIEEE